MTGGEALLSRTSVLSGPPQASSTPPYILTLLHHDVGSAVLRSPGAAEGRQQEGLHQSLGLGLRLPRGLLGTARWTESHRCALLLSQVGAAVGTATAFLCKMRF